MGGWKSILTLLVGFYTLIFSSWLLFKWTDPAYETLISNLGYLPVSLFSAICGVYVASRNHLERQTREAWFFIAIGLISLTIGDIIYLFLDVTRGANFPDIPDIFYLAYYPLVFIGLGRVPSKLFDPSQERTWRLDLSAIVISATAILWFFIIAPTAAAGGEDWFSKLVAGAYPAMDVFVLASITRLLFRRSGTDTRQALLILSLGIVAFIAADIIYAWQVLRDSYISGSAVDILWTISYFIIGLAALRQSSVQTAEGDMPKVSLSAWQSSIPPLVILGLSVLTSMFAATTGMGTNLQAFGLYTGTVVAIFIVLARQIVTIQENSRLINELRITTAQLEASADILEQRVSERTNKLEMQSRRLQQVADIVRDITSTGDIESLLARSTNLISTRFGYYHIGVFLLDNKHEYAILSASPTDTGKQMIADNLRIRVGDPSLVGQVAASGEARFRVNSGTDAAYFNNPLLPDARSEMALPLKVEGNLIGILDIYGNQSHELDEDDVHIMQVLADQLATTIERTNLLQQLQQNMAELEQTYGRTTRESWKLLADGGALQNSGYRFDNIRIQPINEIPEPGSEALLTGNMVIHRGNGQKPADYELVSIPIKLRGQPIGVVSVKLKKDYNRNTINTIQQAIERLALSLESARLYEEARLRADREQAISGITAAISSSADFDAIMRTTVEEIGKSLDDTEVSIYIAENSRESDS